MKRWPQANLMAAQPRQDRPAQHDRHDRIRQGPPTVTVTAAMGAMEAMGMVTMAATTECQAVPRSGPKCHG